jgi:hypothetical protein
MSTIIPSRSEVETAQVRLATLSALIRRLVAEGVVANQSLADRDGEESVRKAGNRARTELELVTSWLTELQLTQELLEGRGSNRLTLETIESRIEALRQLKERKLALENGKAPAIADQGVH